MVELIISSLITVVITSICIHYCNNLNKQLLKLRKQFAYNTSRMRARYHLLNDLRQGKDIHIIMQTLQICNLYCTKYELRNSILPTAHPMHAYALYRIEHNRRAEAIVEGITNWHLALDNNKLMLTILFLDQRKLEVVHWLPT